MKRSILPEIPALKVCLLRSGLNLKTKDLDRNFKQPQDNLQLFNASQAKTTLPLRPAGRAEE